MKKIAIPVLIVVLIVSVMPYVTGRVAESVTMQLSEELGKRHAEYGALTFSDYQRGYGSTEFQLQWQAPTQLQPLFSDPVEYRCEGDHGVFSYNYECKAQNVPSYTEFVNQQLNGRDPLTIGGEVSVFGAFTKKINLEAFTTESDDGSVVRVESGNFEVSTNKDMAVFNLYGEFGGLNVTKQSDAMLMKPMQLAGALTFNEHQIALGNVDFKADEITTTIDGSTVMKVDAIRLKTYSEAEGETLTAGYVLSIDEVQQQLNQNGDAESLQDLNVNTRVSGINMAELAQITERLQNMARYDTRQSLSAEQESTRNAEALALLPELEDLLVAGVGAELGFSAELNDQDMRGELDVALVKDLSLGDFILLSVEPAAFFRKLDLTLFARFPADLIERNQASATAMASSNLFERKSDAYQTDLRIDGENIKLNGTALTVEEFTNKLQLGRRR